MIEQHVMTKQILAEIAPFCDYNDIRLVLAKAFVLVKEQNIELANQMCV